MRTIMLYLLSMPVWARVPDVDSACQYSPWNCTRNVPEPETLALLMIGGVVAYLLRRGKP
jgi:PEP-CTERM motif